MRFVLQPAHPDLETTRNRLLDSLEALLPRADVLEVGSTAVPGCIGKGDLDILIRVDAADFAAARATIDAHHARNRDQLSNAEYQGYTVEADFDAALQLTIRGGPYDDFEGFLDALRSEPERVRSYNALKRLWNGRDMEAYRTAKSAFIRCVLDGPPAVPDSCDVVVVGGSLAGVATALFLARGGVDVVLLEAQSFLGDSASGRGLGPVEHGVVEHPHRTVRALGDRIGQLHGFTSQNRALLEAEGLFERCGALWVSLTEGEAGEIPQSVEALTGCGIRARAWSPEEVAARTGAAMGPALHLPDDGRIDAFGALTTLLERAIAAGVRVVTDAHATVLDGEPLLIEARGRTLAAEMVVLAAGAGCAGLDPRLAAALTPVRDQALLTGPTALPDPGFGRAGQGWTAWRPHPTGGVVVSGARWATPHMEVGESDGTVLEPRIQARLEGFLRDRLGVDAPIVDRWAWVFSNTRDGLPLIGPLPGQSRRIAAVGFGANPASFAVAAARSVADGILHGEGQVPQMLGTGRLVRWR